MKRSKVISLSIVSGMASLACTSATSTAEAQRGHRHAKRQKAPSVDMILSRFALKNIFKSLIKE